MGRLSTTSHHLAKSRIPRYARTPAISTDESWVLMPSQSAAAPSGDIESKAGFTGAARCALVMEMHALLRFQTSKSFARKTCVFQVPYIARHFMIRPNRRPAFKCEYCFFTSSNNISPDAALVKFSQPLSQSSIKDDVVVPKRSRRLQQSLNCTRLDAQNSSPRQNAPKKDIPILTIPKAPPGTCLHAYFCVTHFLPRTNSQAGTDTGTDTALCTPSSLTHLAARQAASQSKPCTHQATWDACRRHPGADEADGTPAGPGRRSGWVAAADRVSPAPAGGAQRGALLGSGIRAAR